MTQIRDIMTTEVQTCTLNDNVYEVAVKMKDDDVGVIPIVNNDKLVGVITDRDIVLRCIAEKNPPSSKVEEVMSSHLVTVTPDTTTQEAASIMAKEQIRRLPVVEDGRLVGIVALADFAVRDLTDNQAKIALSEISEPDEPQAYH
ncbi:CBS domain-containing protein [Lederbergia panacisoli]|uniref:CBS domain-containing protein n=1 Tax=Lederbergia panacisoli TaxID=1255251 RepID=UPI00214BF45C|nr:CBS domain-containing protein [Lederbergia panacisoli]MCR2820842.1 CBS domain-containing protein [Lederbergia panacisoli]